MAGVRSTAPGRPRGHLTKATENAGAGRPGLHRAEPQDDRRAQPVAPDRVRTPRPRALTASDLVRAPDGAVHLTPVATAARLTPVGTAVRLTPVATDGAKSRRGVLTLAARARAANQVGASSSGAQRRPGRQAV